jgi:hypothetical protein
MTTRGILNNNPGNIVYNPANKWQGQTGIESGFANPRFATFSAPEYGIRAIAALLVSYKDKYGLNTITGLITRYAPGNENDTAAYIKDVSDRMGLRPDQPIDVAQYGVIRPMVEAIIIHENGRNPYNATLLDKALLMAGIAAPQKPLKQTSTVKAAAVAGATGATALGVTATTVAPLLQNIDPVDAATKALPIVTGFAEVGQNYPMGLAIAAGVASVALMVYAGWSIWKRWDDRSKGIK